MERFNRQIEQGAFLWALGSFSQLHQIPFDPQLLLQHYPPPYTLASLRHAADEMGFQAEFREADIAALDSTQLPCLGFAPHQAGVQRDQSAASVTPQNAAVTTAGSAHEPSAPHQDPPVDDGTPPDVNLILIAKVEDGRVMYFPAGQQIPQTITLDEFRRQFQPDYLLVTAKEQIPKDEKSNDKPPEFGFRWFIPEVLRHKKIWRDVLLASFAIQLMALATPLFTQVVIDKVIVHNTMNTLLVIGIGLFMFMLFSAVMTWSRQYLVIHTGNRIDAILGHRVFQHLIQLPLRYFEHRPTGTLVARLQGIETIRQFITGAAVTLVLDFPFLFIFLAIMFYYSWQLTMVVVVILGIIAVMSLAITPLLRKRLNDQFQLGARNQAFLTEYVSGMETVKSLQMEPQLNKRYGDYLSTYLNAGFKTRRLSNSYNVVAKTLEQIQTLAILVIGAWMVMTRDTFTIGMLVAFQMFASRLSGPVLRLVGLWQEFQQANIAVKRLGDFMSVPTEPYAIQPGRSPTGKGEITIRKLSFRYADDLPFLYRDFDLNISPGGCIAIMGPSGSGKSTLTKLLQGFYYPTDGQIQIDQRDIRHLSANELRQYFGVVPQETQLFSGTIYENLIMANPHAGFNQVIQACKLAEIHSVIEQLPKGYQNEIGEHGAGLSGGQKQRIAIARALLKQPKVLVFDEATSHLDQPTAEHFAQTVNQLKGKVTILFITHQVPKGLKVDEAVILGQTNEEVISEEVESMENQASETKS